MPNIDPSAYYVRKSTLGQGRIVKRRCLKCNNEFDSLGVGNRICPKCVNNANAASTSRVYRKGKKKK